MTVVQSNPTVAAAVVSWLTPFRMGPKRIAEAFSIAGVMSVQIIAVCACAGIIVGVISLTGVGARFSALLLGLAEASQLLALFFAMCIAILLGMGMPTTAAYAVAASVVAPGLVELGIPLPDYRKVDTREDLEAGKRRRYVELLSGGLERIRRTVGQLLRFTPRSAQAEASPAFFSTRPSRSAAPSITSATERTFPSSVNQFRIRPTASPPRIGMTSTCHHSSVSAKEWIIRKSSVP